MIRGRDLAFLLLSLAVAAVCLRLGFWQLDRLEDRRAQNAVIRTRQALPALDLARVDWSRSDLAYRTAEGEGAWDSAHEIVLVNRARQGVAGVHLVTPLRIEGSPDSILTDRGWLPQESAAGEARAAYAGTGSMRVRGVLKPAQEEPSWSFLADPTPAPQGTRRTSWRVLHIPWIQRQVPYPLAPYYLELTAAPAHGPQPDPEPDLDLSEGPHLGYAIQWFLFSAIALGGGGTWVWKRGGYVPQ